MEVRHEFYHELLLCSKHVNALVKFIAVFIKLFSRIQGPCVLSVHLVNEGCVVGKSDMYTCDMSLQVSIASAWYKRATRFPTVAVTSEWTQLCATVAGLTLSLPL
jgi:hypothetical protein